MKRREAEREAQIEKRERWAAMEATMRAAAERAKLRAPAHKRWLKVHEVARLLSISLRRAYYLIEEGRIPHINMGRRMIRVREDALLEFMAECGGRASREQGWGMRPGAGWVKPRRDIAKKRDR